jgi:ferritin-like metal-binding protein YciE
VTRTRQNAGRLLCESRPCNASEPAVTASAAVRVASGNVLEEGSEVLEDTDKGIVRDAALISASQRVEHYEMAGYGSAREFAKLLGHSDVAALLDESLAEEKNADKKLSVISKQVNAEAKRAN